VEQLVTQLRAFWAGLGLWQRAVFIGLPALLLVGALAALILVVGAPPAQAPLFRNLETKDAALVVAELKKQNIEYDLENEGRDIIVPASQVYDLRLQLAILGLPRSAVGFELFDKPKLGMTEQGMQIDKQRALQGELMRTLESLDPVESASVTLNISPETSFLDVDTHSSASVMLHLKGGQGLGEAQVQGIKLLVSRAVPRLSEDDVTVVDSSGNPLMAKDDSTPNAQQLAGMQLTDLQERFRAKVARNFEDKIRKVLEGPYGPGNVSPSVAVEIDFRNIHNESENYEPVVDDQGIEKRVEEHREKSTGGTETQGGVPGSTSNIPGYLGISNSEGTTTDKSKYDLLVDYLVNKKVSVEELPPGTIIKRSAAVAISTDTWDDATKRSVESLIASAIGADTTKGDSIMAQAFQFSDLSQTTVAQQYAAQRGSRAVSRIAGWVLAILMVAILALVLRSIVQTSLPKEAFAVAGGSGERGAEAMEIKPTEAEEFALKRLDELGATSQARMRNEINRMIDTKPEQVAILLRSWMLEDQ
jgi:flagellar M-ring protein FliF